MWILIILAILVIGGVVWYYTSRSNGTACSCGDVTPTPGESVSQPAPRTQGPETVTDSFNYSAILRPNVSVG